MKKFIIEVLIMLSLIFFTLKVLYQIDWPTRLKNLEAKKGNIELITLGTSHGSDFELGKCPLESFYLNISGNTLYYDLHNYLFLKERGCLAEKAIVLIPVSYFAFGLDENRTDVTSGDAFTNRFYKYLPPKHIYNYSLKKESELFFFSIQKNFNSLTTKSKNRKKKHKQGNKKEPSLDEKAEMLKEHAVKRAKHHQELCEYSSEPKNIAYLERLIQEVKSAKHQVILLTTPYYYLYNEYMGKELLEQKYFNRMRKMSEKFDVPYLDYSHDKRFTYSPDLFKNSDHLNNKGRNIFSEIFFKDITAEINKAQSVR